MFPNPIRQTEEQVFVKYRSIFRSIVFDNSGRRQHCQGCRARVLVASAVSKCIDELEALFRVPLLERSEGVSVELGLLMPRWLNGGKDFKEAEANGDTAQYWRDHPIGNSIKDVAGVLVTGSVSGGLFPQSVSPRVFGRKNP